MEMTDQPADPLPTPGLWQRLRAMFSRTVVPRDPAQSCGNCIHFADHRCEEDDPDECDGYCCMLMDTLGFEKAFAIHSYGGHWTHHAQWCSQWEGGDPIWVRES